MKLEREQLAAAFTSRLLHLIILPTEQCNFRCTYCYEDFFLEQMRPGVVRGIKALTSERAPELDGLNISWFGGEPLVARRLVLDLSEHFQSLADEHGSLSYSAHMTTNGYLLDLPLARRLVGLGVRDYQISLDGPPAIHDETRVKQNGAGTFRQIWGNLRAFRDSGLDAKFMIRVHFTPHTYKRLEPLIEMLNKEFGGDMRFPIYFKPVERLGGPDDDQMPVFHNDAEKDAVKQYLDSLLTSEKQAYHQGSGKTYICYAARPNSLLIRPNGELGKCTVALYDARNRLGSLNEDGTIDIDQDKLRIWLRGFQSLNEQELGCPYATMEQAFVENRGRYDTLAVRKTLPLLTTS
jgi:uncharacterized protein